MIQLTRQGMSVSGSAADLGRLSAEFAQEHVIRLPQLVEAKLLRFLRRQIDRAEFYERYHKRIGATDLCMEENAASGLLHFLANDPKFHDVIRRITGCGRIGCFTGKVYRVVPGVHHDAWHSDTVEHRMIGMSVNLSKEVYRGGVFRIRHRESGQILHEIHNTGFGDAIIFPLAPHLQHRITDVEGTVPRTAFAGWFRSRPEAWPFAPERVGARPRALSRGRGGERRAVRLDSRVRIPEEVVYRGAGEEAVLLNLVDGFYYRLNPVGSRAWELLAERGSLGAVLQTMAREYAVATERLEEDILRLVGKLEASGLVHVER